MTAQGYRWLSAQILLLGRAYTVADVERLRRRAAMMFPDDRPGVSRQISRLWARIQRR